LSIRTNSTTDLHSKTTRHSHFKTTNLRWLESLTSIPTDAEKLAGIVSIRSPTADDQVGGDMRIRWMSEIRRVLLQSVTSECAAMPALAAASVQ
jgi:hypothetical protein